MRRTILLSDLSVPHRDYIYIYIYIYICVVCWPLISRFITSTSMSSISWTAKPNQLTLQPANGTQFVITRRSSTTGAGFGDIGGETIEIAMTLTPTALHRRGLPQTSKLSSFFFLLSAIPPIGKAKIATGAAGILHHIVGNLARSSIGSIWYHFSCASHSRIWHFIKICRKLRLHNASSHILGEPCTC